LPINARCIVASIYWRSAGIPILNSKADFFTIYAAFCLFVRTLPIDFALLGRKRKYIKSKTTRKLKGKQTLIAAVRDHFLPFAPSSLLSRYRLPLSVLGKKHSADFSGIVCSSASLSYPLLFQLFVLLYLW
jgi:hypothetical protein